jgi:hypothetical protein
MMTCSVGRVARDWKKVSIFNKSFSIEYNTDGEMTDDTQTEPHVENFETLCIVTILAQLLNRFPHDILFPTHHHTYLFVTNLQHADILTTFIFREP